MTSYRIYFEGFMNTEQESEDEATQEVYDRLKETSIQNIKITDVEEE